MPTRAEIEDALRNADAAGDVEAARQLADALVNMSAPAAGTPETAASMGPTRRRIRAAPEGQLDLGRTVRAAGAYVPGADYAGAAGTWLQDRFPQALGGVADGQERTWQESLGDYRAERQQAETAEPGSALAGAALVGRKLPFTGGRGVAPALTRALQAAGYATGTEMTRGASAADAAEQGGVTGALSAGIEGALHLPGALRALGKAARGRAADHAWWAGSPTPTQAAGMAESLGDGVSAQRPVGEFMRDARLASGQRLLERGDAPADVARKLKQYLDEWGAKKGAAVRSAEAQGAVVDPRATLSEIKALVKELDSPEMRVNYPEVKKGLDDWVERFAKEYGPPVPVRGPKGQFSKAEQAPRTLQEWERLKTTIQSLVHDTKSGLARKSEAIDASPALDRLRAIASTVREADEVAAKKVLSPEEFKVFMEAKRNYGTAAEIQPGYTSSVRAAERPAAQGANSYEMRRIGRGLPWALTGAGAGAMPGLAANNIPLAVAGGLAGATAAKIGTTLSEAHPTMTRAYDAIGRTLGRVKGPPVDVDPQVAALIAYLRNAVPERGPDAP